MSRAWNLVYRMHYYKPNIINIDILVCFIMTFNFIPSSEGGGRVVQRCWVNFQYWDVLLIWIIVGQGPIALAVGAGGGCLDIFSLIYRFSFLSPSL